jgi:hypothetical protein
MRIVVFTILYILFITGCSSGDGYGKRINKEVENTFILRGSLLNGNGSYLFFEENTAGKFLRIDSILTDSDGKFISQLTLNHKNLYFLRNQTGDYIVLFPSASDTITIEANYYDFSDYTLFGNKESMAIADLHRRTRSFMKEVNEIARITNDSLESYNYATLKYDLIKKYDSLYRDFKEFSLKFITLNISSPISLLALNNQIGRELFVFNLQNDFEIFARVDSVLYPLYPDFPAVQELHDRIHAIRTRASVRDEGNKIIPNG